MVGEILGGMIEGLARSLAICFIIALIGFLGCGYFIYDKWIRDSSIKESSHKIIPTYKLHTDGKTIDTIWIYKFDK